MLKSCFNAYKLSSLEYCASVWMSSAKSHLGSLDNIVRSAEKLCEGELCYLGHRMKVSALCLTHPMNEYLKHFVAARNNRVSAALGELALVIPPCRTDQFSRLFLHASLRVWN